MQIRYLGYACINSELKSKDIRANRSVRLNTLNKLSTRQRLEIVRHNLDDLLKILKWNLSKGIKFFRIPGNIVPWHDRWANWRLSNYTLEKTYEIKKFVLENNIRLSMHPDHFVKLGSEKQGIVHNSLKEILYSGSLLKLLSGQNQDRINIHIGGAYGDKEKTAQRWLHNFYRIPQTLRAHVTIENDDKAGLYNTKELYDLFSKKHQIPIAFDFFHHRCNPTKDLTEEEAAELALFTWPANVTPIFHWSESRREEQKDQSIIKTAHSDLCYGPLPDYNLSRPVDLMLECKHKEQSINTLKYNNGKKVQNT